MTKTYVKPSQFSAATVDAMRLKLGIENENGAFSIGRIEMQKSNMNFPVVQEVFMSDFDEGQIDNNWGISLNGAGESALHPRWSENIENFFDADSGGRLLEKNWSYVSIDGLTEYRPFNFNVNIDTHNADMYWVVSRYRIQHRQGSDYALDFDTTVANPSATFRSAVAISRSFSSNLSALRVGGNSSGSGLVVFEPSSIADNTSILTINNPVLTNKNLMSMQIQGSVSNGKLGALIYNTSNTGTALMQIANLSASKDSYLICSNLSTWWSMGLDSSESNTFKISNNHEFGTNDFLKITTAGNATFAGRISATLATYADNAAAITGGLVATDMYKTATGEVRIVV